MKCQACGCTDENACVAGAVTCFWITPTLCSMCASVRDVASEPAGHAWLLMLLASIAMDEVCPDYEFELTSPNQIIDVGA